MSKPAGALGALSALAAEAGASAAVAAFQPAYLERVLDETGAAPAAVLQKLRAAVDVYAELHALEDRMDRALFKQLVTGGYFMVSGRTRDGRLVLWFRCGLLGRGLWKVGADKPQGAAYVRAIVWMFSVVTVQARRLSDSKYTMIIDEQGKGVVDFNLPLLREIMRLSSTAFPFQSSNMKAVVFGMPSLVSVAWKAVRSIMGTAADDVTMGESYASVADIVSDPACVPVWWQTGGRLAYNAADRRNVWCYERCLGDGDRVVAADVMNPGPWPYAAEPSTACDAAPCALDAVSSAARPKRRSGGRGGNGLHAIAEDGAGEE